MINWVSIIDKNGDVSIIDDKAATTLEHLECIGNFSAVGYAIYKQRFNILSKLMAKITNKMHSCHHDYKSCFSPFFFAFHKQKCWLSSMIIFESGIPTDSYRDIIQEYYQVQAALWILREIGWNDMIIPLLDRMMHLD